MSTISKDQQGYLSGFYELFFHVHGTEEESNYHELETSYILYNSAMQQNNH